MLHTSAHDYCGSCAAEEALSPKAKTQCTGASQRGGREGATRYTGRGLVQKVDSINGPGSPLEEPPRCRS